MNFWDNAGGASSIHPSLQHCCTSSGAARAQRGMKISQPPPIEGLITVIIKAWPNGGEISSRRFVRSKHRVLTAPLFGVGFPLHNVNLKKGCREIGSAETLAVLGCALRPVHGRSAQLLLYMSVIHEHPSNPKL